MSNFGSFKNEHLSNLMDFCSANESAKDLYEYFEILSNIDYENKKDKKNKEKFTSQVDSSFTNKNAHHCEHCKKTFFTKEKLNFQTVTKAKVHLSHRTSKLFAISKLIKKKYKYRSYRQKQLENITKNGSTLIYKCNRCNRNNLIYKENKRNNLHNLKLVKIKTQKSDSFKCLANYTSILKINEKPEKIKSHARNRKFQTLKTMMENDLIEKKKKEQEQNNPLAGLLGFLNKI
jgi:hypothetical protein